MTGLDHDTLLSLATDLAHHLAADYVRRADLSYLSDTLGDAALTAHRQQLVASYEPQLVATLAPGLVAFAARLSAASAPAAAGAERLATACNVVRLVERRMKPGASARTRQIATPPLRC